MASQLLAQTLAAVAPHVQISLMNGFIGAEIGGVDLRKPLSAEEFKVVHDALVRYEVIVFRDQDITLEQQIAFGRQFGELSVSPFSPSLEDNPEVIVLDYTAEDPAQGADRWHSDETYRSEPPMGTILRSRTVPRAGGDTLFCSMSAAYRGLSERMKQYIHGLEAFHDFPSFRRYFTNSPEDKRKLRDIEDRFPNPVHPVVRVHPISGRRVLYVNWNFTIRIKDMKEDESRIILDFLFRQAHIPEYQLRVKWKPNTVVFWDNRSTQHYAPHDYWPESRKMERITLCGDKPVGVVGPYVPEEGFTPGQRPFANGATEADVQAAKSKSSPSERKPVRPFKR